MQENPNPQEQAPKQSTPEQTSSANAGALLKQLTSFSFSFIKDRFSIIDMADPLATIAGIKKDVEFRGFALWILIFSVFIASIGLNVNSTAVVIGAMLISPLMGPIMGIGLSLGINDFALLFKSLKNLGVAVGIALMASSLYFLLSPISTPSNELFARTNPTLLDVLVAFFGGLAGILAGSRKEKSNVIPGVAIATALMPPLCTAGFGLAHGDWHYFLGAMYLFLINTVIIATTTTVATRYLRFPMVEILDPIRSKKTQRWFSVALIVIIVPSIWIFYRTVTNSLNQGKVESYISQTIVFPGAEIVKEDVKFNGGAPQVSVVLFGELVPDNLTNKWISEFDSEFNGELIIVQGDNPKNGLLEMSKLVNLYSEGRAEVKSYQDQIYTLESELKMLENQLIPATLANEIKINYPSIKALSIGSMQGGITDSTSGYKIPVAFVEWEDEILDNEIIIKKQQLAAWLVLRLNADSVLVK